MWGQNGPGEGGKEGEPHGADTAPELPGLDWVGLKAMSLERTEQDCTEGLGSQTWSLEHCTLTSLLSTLRVPFRSPLEAEAGRRSLTEFGESPDIHRVLYTNGNILTV